MSGFLYIDFNNAAISEENPTISISIDATRYNELMHNKKSIVVQNFIYEEDGQSTVINSLVCANIQFDYITANVIGFGYLLGAPALLLLTENSLVLQIGG